MRKNAKRKSTPRAANFARCLEKARALLRDSADWWARGDPEEPATLEVLLNLLQMFAREGFLYFPTEAGIDTAVPRHGVSEAKSAG
ncbi:MAG: hypothetical protein ACYS47_18275 [Planctomycetota bacterium]|jgi:hypothetical protein